MMGLIQGILFFVFVMGIAALVFEGIARARVTHDEPRTLSVEFCTHPRRFPYQSGWSIGDFSDYESECASCGTLLRERPNA